MRNRDEGCRVRPTCQSLGFRISENWDAAEEDAVVCLVHEVEMNMKQMNLRCV